MHSSLLLGLVVMLSLLAFVLCGWDKSQAITRGRRVPERVLLMLAAGGGSPGLLVGMLLFRHKTRSPGFLLAYAAIALAQLVWLLW